MVTTAQILCDRAMQVTCGEQCVEWAINLLEGGYESTPTLRLAAMLPPYNHFELASLRDQILAELGVCDMSDGDALIHYAIELLGPAVQNTVELDSAIAKIKDLYVRNGYGPKEVYDFYLLYFARRDLKVEGSQHYWPGADSSNIERITNDRVRQFLSDYGDRMKADQ